MSKEVRLSVISFRQVETDLCADQMRVVCGVLSPDDVAKMAVAAEQCTGLGGAQGSPPILQ